MKELLKLAKGTARNWRDFRKWDKLPPEIRAIAPALRYHVPNTKYGNALVPWLLRQHKLGNITLDSSYSDYGSGGRYYKELLRSLRKVREWQGKEGHPQQKQKIKDWQQRANVADENLYGSQKNYYNSREHNRHYGGEHEWYLKGWPQEDYGDNGELAQAVNEIIELQKRQKQRGLEPIDPMQFQDPKSLKGFFDRQELERMRNSGEVLHTLPNNWTVRRLTNQQDADWEGRNMDHCVAEYGSDLYHPKHNQRGEYILSLRDPNNKPHVTWTIGNRDVNPAVDMMYGKANSDPKPEYKNLIKQYYENFPIEQRPKGEDLAYINSHTEFGQPSVDEYGLPAQAYPQWSNVLRSTWAQDPQGKDTPGYYPENIQKVLDAARGMNQERELGGQVREQSQAMDTFLKERQREGEYGDPAYQATLMTPWAQTLKHYQTALNEQGWGDASGTNIMQHYGSNEARPHIGVNGKYCDCRWGEYRPAWDPEWDYHTNWDEEDSPWTRTAP